jgi:FixJ family two-component response regulator
MMARTRTVAVVDDEAMMRTAIKHALESLGFVTRLFSSGRAFLDFSASDEIDCVLLDIHLGDMSGFELHRRLEGARSMLPVIYMSGSDDEAIRAQALKADCVAFLRKPFPAEQLLEALEKAMLQKPSD